ncbi:transcriptional regulator, MarR family [Paenibacillus sp. GP183]|nr:transcriptional regulator, MarR family [Paenibacillus sp. GP183]
METPDYAATCACFNLRKASRVITSLYDDYMRPAGLRSTQVMLLMALEKAGPVTVMRLSDFLLLDRTTLTRDLKLLERQGLVSITEGEDRRRRYIALTPEGRVMLSSALPLWEQAQTHVRMNMGDDRYEALLGNLSDVVKLNRKA